MSYNSILADSLARIKNAQMRRKEFVTVKSSKFIKMVLAALKNEGYIANFEEFEQNEFSKVIKVDLKYVSVHKSLEPVIKLIKMISKPGRRCYSSSRDLKKSNNGLGALIISTPKGVLSDAEARKLNVGGEVLFEIY